jgi:myo-inositol 2-dehydrogenase/D-chiro-inositol 1-dehydrogenase
LAATLGVATGPATAGDCSGFVQIRTRIRQRRNGLWCRQLAASVDPGERGNVRDQRIGIAVLGAGRIGRLHAENLAHQFGAIADLQLVADARVETAREVAASCGRARFTADWREAVADPAVQAVVVCTPTDTHTPIVETAAAARKHVFCEKPLALDLPRTESALAAAGRAGVWLQVGFNRRFDPSFERLARGVRDGEIGAPQFLRITSRDPEPPPLEYVRSSGGLFLDMAIHDFDMARFVTGDEVVEVHAVGAALVDPEIGRAGDVDTAVVTLRFARGALGSIDNSRRATYGYDQRVEILGSRGALVAGHRGPTQVSRWDASGRTTDRQHHFFVERYSEAYAAEMRSFLESVRDGHAPSVGGMDALQALRIALAARQSLSEGRPVRVELAEVAG